MSSSEGTRARKNPCVKVGYHYEFYERMMKEEFLVVLMSRIMIYKAFY